MASQTPDDLPPPVTPVPAVATAGGMAERIRRLLLEPKSEWPRIDAEPMTVKGIMTGWAAPLAAIGPVATFLRWQLFPIHVLGISYRPPMGALLAGVVVSYVTALIGVYVFALVIDHVGPNFDAARNMVAATKVAVFSATAAWLAQAFLLIPPLNFLLILGLYSLYLLWIGLPALMKPPADKAQTYAAVSIACGLIAALVVSFLAREIASALTPPMTGVGSISFG